MASSTDAWVKSGGVWKTPKPRAGSSTPLLSVMVGWLSGMSGPCLKGGASSHGTSSGLNQGGSGSPRCCEYLPDRHQRGRRGTGNRPNRERRPAREERWLGEHAREDARPAPGGVVGPRCAGATPSRDRLVRRRPKGRGLTIEGARHLHVELELG